MLQTYIGESSRSSYERGKKHTNDVEQLNPTSHMSMSRFSQQERAISF